MKVLKFKTNIEDEESVRQVSSHLDQESSISKWNIDIERSDNLLSVSGDEIDPEIVKALIERAGYKAHFERALGLGGEDI